MSNLNSSDYLFFRKATKTNPATQPSMVPPAPIMPDHKPDHRPAHRPDYRRYTRIQLCKSLTDRQCFDPEASRALLTLSKGQLLSRLQRLDRQRLRFPCFMDLPPELRLLVYQELLVPAKEDAKRMIHPQILRVSKKVFGKSQAVLYDDNEFVVRFSWIQTRSYCGFSEYGGLQTALEMAGKQVLHNTLRRPFENLGFEIPSALRRAKHLMVDLELLGVDDLESRISEQVALASVIFVLSGSDESSRTEAVTVRLSEKGQFRVGVEDLSKVLWPGTLLPKNMDFHVHGASTAVLDAMANKARLAN